MSQFSGAVKLADLNDFIAPSQACVVSLDDLKEKVLPSDFQDVGVSVAPRPSKSGWSQTLPTKTEADPVKISLQDCLACSGCVTSAETILLENQSTGELLQKLQDPTVNVVVTLSRQSLASLAATWKSTPEEVAAKLAACLKALGAKAVLDAGSGQELALLEAAAEFLERYKAASPNSSGQNGMRPCGERVTLGHDDPSQPMAEDMEQRRLSGVAASTSGGQSQERAVNGKRRRGAGPSSLPMLASACPGWICYAEKTHGDYVLPYISSTKSPQAIMGTLIKRHWAPKHGFLPASVYHCAVMPCFDKKLEASREDFNIPGTTTPETDSVLTTTELQSLLEEQARDLQRIEGEDLDDVFGGKHSRLTGMPGGSGGYLEYVYRVAASQLFGVSLPDGALPLKAVRNTDFKEIALEVEGKVVLRFALAYGFRNIQTILRRVKQGLSQYDYIEVMACPSGCINGGGQVPPQKGEALQDRIASVDSQYHHEQIARQRPEESLKASKLYTQFVGSSPFSEPAKGLLHTGYHKRDKSLATTVKDW